MSSWICIRKKDRCDGWLTIDCREDEGIETMVVVPLFGPNHRAGTDCWCQPEMNDDGVIVHRECH